MTLDELLPSTEEEEKTGPVKEPSKRWRNKWLLDGPSRVDDGLGEVHRCDAGVFWGRILWPSKEIAETKAMMEARPGRGTRYLGAFPLTED